MKRIVRLVGIVVLSLVTGCAGLRTSPGNANDQIDAWLSQHEYEKALALVADLKASPSPANSNLQEIQEKIHTRIARYEQQIIAEAEKAAAVNEWGTAFDLYRDALSHLPDSQPLQHGQRQLRHRHAEHLGRLELERLMAKGEWTLKDLEISKLAEAHHSGGWFGQYALNRNTAAANDLALELAEQGKRALERKDPALAQRIFALARNLSNAIEGRPGNTHAQETVQEGESGIRNGQRGPEDAGPAAQTRPAEPHDIRERSAVDRQEQKNAKRLMADFRKACQEKDFAQAQQLMSQLEKQGVETQEFAALSRQLGSDVAKHVKHLIETGATHYSRQRYEEAMTVWQQAQVLDPKNEQLAARIKRVTRVLEKLENLRNKNAATK